MPFLKLNDLEIDVGVDDLEVEYTDAQAFQRGEAMTLEGTMYREIREWSFEVPVWDNGLEAEAFRGWIKGRGHYWTFSRRDGATTRFNKYSADGGPGFDLNMRPATTALAKFGTWGLLLNDNKTTSVDVGFGSEGRYSISVWKRDNSGNQILCSAISDGATLRYKAGATGNGITTAFAWATISAVSGSMSVSLIGKDTSGTNATAAYSGLMIVPYSLTTDQLTARNGRTAAEPVFPYLELAGDFSEDVTSVIVKGFVDSEQFNPTVSVTRTPRVRLIQK